VHVVLKRKSLQDRGKIAKGKAKSTTQTDSEQAHFLSLSEMGEAWQGFNAGVQETPLPDSPSGLNQSLQRVASGLSGADVGEPEGEEDVNVDDLENTVRQQLATATEELVSQSVATAAGNTEMDEEDEVWLREALLEEFLPVTDALMESLVTGNLEEWLNNLGVAPPGSSAQHSHFEALRVEFRDALGEGVNSDVVGRVCQATVSAAELRTSCCHRANELLLERRKEDEAAAVVERPSIVRRSAMQQSKTLPQEGEAEDSEGLAEGQLQLQVDANEEQRPADSHTPVMTGGSSPDQTLDEDPDLNPGMEPLQEVERLDSEQPQALELQESF